MRTRSRLLAATALATAAANLAVAQSGPMIPVAPPPGFAPPSGFLIAPPTELPTIPTVPILAPIPQPPAERKEVAKPVVPKADDKKPAETKPADKPADKKAETPPNPMAPAVLPPGMTLPPAGPLPPGAMPPAPGAPAACDTCNKPAAPAPYKVPPHNGPAEAGWVRATSTLYFFKPHELPFAIATGNRPGRASQVLLGADNVNVQEVNGIAIDGGMWLSGDHTFGVGLGGFLMEQKLRTETAVGTAANGFTISRPFIDAVTGDPTSLTVAAPGLATGSIVSNVSSRLSGGEANLRRNVINNCDFSFDLFYGFRYLDLDESLTVFQATRPLVDTAVSLGLPTGGRAPVGAGQTLLLTDRVKTRNQFYGGEIGGRFEARSGMFFVAVTPRVGFGPTHQVTEIDGSSRIVGTAFTSPGGLLAVGNSPTATRAGDGNIGRHSVNRFTLATDFGAQFGVQLTKSVRVSAGYNFLYMNNVVRPGEQLQTAVNARLVPASASFSTLSGPRSPQLTQDRDAFYAHGATLGFEFLY